MYNLQINNRFVHLDYDDENEENVETNKKPLAETKKTENKKDASKKPQKANAAPTAKVTNDKLFNDSPPKPQGRQGGNAAPAHENKPFGVPLSGNNENNRRPRPPVEGSGSGGGGFGGSNFGRSGGGGGGGGAFSNLANRGGRGGGHFDNRGKREFDRKSGSEKAGVRASDKRDGGGSHNWGNSIRDFTTETFAPPADGEPESEDKTATAAEEKTGEGNNDGANAPVVPENQEPVVMSLDEYMKQKEKSKLDLPTRQMRKAGEGEGSFSGIKMGKKIQKKRDDGEEMVKIVEEKGSGRVKKVLEVNFPSMANRGRGRRGRGNYGGNSGGRGDVTGSFQPNIMDEAAFPALSQ